MHSLSSSSRAPCCGCSQQSRAAGTLLAAVRQPARCLWMYRPSRAANQHQQREAVRKRTDRLQMRAGPVDAPPTWTLDQIAGLAFGALMVAFYFSATAVDAFVARQQRRELGLCEECGGIYDAATCTQQRCPLKGKQ